MVILVNDIDLDIMTLDISFVVVSQVVFAVTRYISKCLLTTKRSVQRKISVFTREVQVPWSSIEYHN